MELEFDATRAPGFSCELKAEHFSLLRVGIIECDEVAAGKDHLHRVVAHSCDRFPDGIEKFDTGELFAVQTSRS